MAQGVWASLRRYKTFMDDIEVLRLLEQGSARWR
jgi:hypothetical protein